MELFLVPVPIFDKYLAVEAYLFRYHLMDQGSAPNEQSPLFKALDENSVEAFTGGRPIFIPITASKLSSLAAQCTLPPDLTVFLIENAPLLGNANLKKMETLRERRYRFALLQTDRTFNDPELLSLADFIVFDTFPMEHEDRRAMVIRYERTKKSLQIVATGLDENDKYTLAKKDGFHLFEGKFIREPHSRNDRELSPIKVNLIRLLDLVRDENFEFKDIAEVMRRDPALSYSLMRFINSPYLGIKYKVKSIQHAVTILGQTEVRKWITAAVFKALGSDHPSELTRLSLVRAKYAENLSEYFGLGAESNGVFLMGLFSSLDAMLGTSMDQALEQVHVSDEINEALVKHSGPYFPALDFVQQYERANWPIILQYQKEMDLPANVIYEAYLNSVGWYNELITEQRVKLRRPPPGFHRA